MKEPCPCGANTEYLDCCGRFLDGGQKASTAEELMRSRYCAFTKVKMDYLYYTSHPKIRDETDIEGNKQWATSADWKGLEILNTEQGQPGDKEGKVEFIARYAMDGEDHEHHELASFRHYKGQWFFYDGKDPQQSTQINSKPKIGRNEPCPCGSGKKYKKCCGKN